MEVKILLKFISFGVDNVKGGKVDIEDIIEQHLPNSDLVKLYIQLKI